MLVTTTAQSVLLPTDLLVSLTRIPIALSSTDPGLASQGWTLLSWVLAQSLVAPYVDIADGPKQTFSELHTLAMGGYEPLREKLRARYELATQDSPTSQISVAALEQVKQLLEVKLERTGPLEPIDPSWVILMTKLDRLLLAIETESPEAA